MYKTCPDLKKLNPLTRGFAVESCFFTFNSFNHKPPYGSKGNVRETLEISFVTFFWKRLGELRLFLLKYTKFNLLAQKVQSAVWITEIFDIKSVLDVIFNSANMKQI